MSTTIATATASIPGRVVRTKAANPSRPLSVVVAGVAGIKTVIVRGEDARYTVERWVTSNGRPVASCGQTYYGTEKKALNASGDWLFATALLNGGQIVVD